MTEPGTGPVLVTELGPGTGDRAWFQFWNWYRYWIVLVIPVQVRNPVPVGS